MWKRLVSGESQIRMTARDVAVFLFSEDLSTPRCRCAWRAEGCIRRNLCQTLWPHLLHSCPPLIGHTDCGLHVLRHWMNSNVIHKDLIWGLMSFHFFWNGKCSNPEISQKIWQKGDWEWKTRAGVSLSKLVNWSSKIRTHNILWLNPR